MRFFFAHPVLPSVHARSARVGIGERESRRAWGQQLVVRGKLHLPTGKLVMRVARVAPKRARCFNSKGTSFHVVLELEHVKPVDQRSAIRKADAVLPAFARAGQRHDTLKPVAQRGRCRLLFSSRGETRQSITFCVRRLTPLEAENCKQDRFVYCTGQCLRTCPVRFPSPAFV